MTFDRAALIADLTRDEGLRLTVYDDATGQPIRPGSVVKGHPTIGIGRCLDTHGIDIDEAVDLLGNDIDATAGALDAALPWWRELAPARQSVLINMAFNLGVGGLLSFAHTLAAIRAGDYACAAEDMLASAWAGQVGERAKRLAQIMATG